MEATVRFKGWTPLPRAVVVGMERDNKVFTLRFEGLPAYSGGTAYLHIDFGSAGADSIEIVDGLAEITRNITQHEGEQTAYVEIIANNDVVWHSDRMLIYVNPLPPVGEKIEQAYPTAFEQALAQTAADKAAAAKSAAAAAATAAGIVTEEAARQDAESKRVEAEAARKTAEAKREQAEAAREQEMAEALASVAGVENVVRANEQQRVQEEQHRETAETARAEAERQRESMETSRQTAETARNAAESGRVTAEQDRVSAESQRQQAETARADAEGNRVQAEQGRVTAEQGRVEAETKREETMAQHAEKIAELETEVAKKAQIDDTTVSSSAPWSSQHIVDMLCPPLEESGNPVVCYPVAGRKLGVKMSWEPTQDGEGTPSPDNIRPIHGRNSVSITRREDELSVVLTLPSTAYGGEVNAATGDGQETWKLLTLDGTERWQDNGNVASIKQKQWALYNILAPYSGNFGIASHFDNVKGSQVYPFNFVRIANTSIVLHVALDGPFASVDSLKSYLAAQYAAGTPVQIAYNLAIPVPFTATGGGTIKALSGTNTVLTDADTLAVTGRADPIHIIQQLQAASATSAQALADVERAVTDI